MENISLILEFILGAVLSSLFWHIYLIGSFPFSVSAMLGLGVPFMGNILVAVVVNCGHWRVHFLWFLIFSDYHPLSCDALFLETFCTCVYTFPMLLFFPQCGHLVSFLHFDLKEKLWDGYFL